jgi:hypothetical protein
MKISLKGLARTFRRAILYVLIACIVCALALSYMQYGFKFFLSSCALGLVSLIMFLRCNDLGFRPGFFWMKRRIGFILVGTMPIAILYTHAMRGAEDLTFFDTLFHIGMALVFMTTPYLPPFWEWLMRGVDAHEDSRGMPRRRKTDKQEDIA